MSEVEYGVDPLELAVLLAIKEGLSDPRRIAEYLNVDENSVLEALEDLKEKGLIKEEERKVLFFTTKELKLTRKGYNTLVTALEKLAPKLQEVRKVMVTRGEDEARAMLEAMGLGLVAPLLLPLLLAGALLPVALFSPHHDSHIHPGEPF